jgi:hypothetical protein
MRESLCMSRRDKVKGEGEEKRRKEKKRGRD